MIIYEIEISATKVKQHKKNNGEWEIFAWWASGSIRKNRVWTTHVGIVHTLFSLVGHVGFNFPFVYV